MRRCYHVYVVFPAIGLFYRFMNQWQVQLQPVILLLFGRNSLSPGTKDCNTLPTSCEEFIPGRPAIQKHQENTLPPP